MQASSLILMQTSVFQVKGLWSIFSIPSSNIFVLRSIKPFPACALLSVVVFHHASAFSFSLWITGVCCRVRALGAPLTSVLWISVGGFACCSRGVEPCQYVLAPLGRSQWLHRGF